MGMEVGRVGGLWRLIRKGKFDIAIGGATRGSGIWRVW